MGRLNLVDLAGSENIARSGAKKVQAKEAGHINQVTAAADGDDDDRGSSRDEFQHGALTLTRRME